MTASPRPRPSRRLAALPVLALAAFAPGLNSVSAAAAPEPAPIPRRWQLDVETSPLRATVVDLPGTGSRAYFYMTFKVTNNSTTDVLFAPAFELATDDMALLRSGRDVPVGVTNEIKNRLQNPLLEDQISIVGTLLRGAENAKEGLVIWPVPAEHQFEVTVYAAGFSGETATVEVPMAAATTATAPLASAARVQPAPTLPQPARASATVPVADPPAAKPGQPKGAAAAAPSKTEKKVLRKTLMLRYRLPGDLQPGRDAPMEPIESRWIMR
jgi:hypothetical protein